MINTWVRNNKESGFLERLLDLISKTSRTETSEDGGRSSVSSELQEGTLSVRTGRNDDDIGGIFNSRDGTSSQEKFLPGFFQVDDIGS